MHILWKRGKRRIAESVSICGVHTTQEELDYWQLDEGMLRLDVITAQADITLTKMIEECLPNQSNFTPSALVAAKLRLIIEALLNVRSGTNQTKPYFT